MLTLNFPLLGYEGVDNFVEILCSYLINTMSVQKSSDLEQFSDPEKQIRPKRLKVCTGNEHCMMYKCQKEQTECRNIEGFGYSSDSMTSDAESQDETTSHLKQQVKRCSKHCQKQ